MTPAEHIERANAEIEYNRADHATAHALIAIAELMATNMTNAIMEATTSGAVAAAEAISSIFSIVNPGGTLCGARGDSGAACTLPAGHPDRHANGQTWWTH
ncbi:MAG: hypothetical protein M3Y90_15590 [Actinomycetota bacterium]|nr:hypothetical protein [Actinomycetota bacterium]